MKVGFITPNNDIFEMEYDQVLTFCKDLCMLEENYNNWLKFNKNYTYFDSYFDFVMKELGYIFINPLCKDNTYLKCINNKMYMIEKDELELVNYDLITDLGKQHSFDLEYSTIVLCSDQELNIKKVSFEKIQLSNCFIDPNGYSMITKSDEKLGNHEITANTIINQLLMHDKELIYNPNSYSVIFLLENYGFIQTAIVDNNITNMAGVLKLLPDELKLIKDICVNSGTCVFVDWEKHANNLPDKLRNYSIKEQNLGRSK